MGHPKVQEEASKGYDLSAHQTLSRVVLLIRENYVEPDRIKPYDMFLAALDYIQRTVAEVLVDDSQAPARITVSVGAKSRAFDLGGMDELWEVTMALRDIFRFLQGHITDPAKQQDIEYAAINGMLSTLDPHSILLKPENFDEMKLSTRGEFGGLGIVISIRDGGLTIIAPIEGTPAGLAGLRAKDKIVKIGEESTINMALDEAVQILRGPPDTNVTISVQRKAWTEPRQFVLTRAIIKIESVTSELLADGVGYIKIKSFQGNTYDDLETHLKTLTKRNGARDLTGLVLDLRNNPGGLLDQAILVSDRFISKGPLVITVGEGARKREVKNAHAGPDENTYPIAVLLNGGSASASEIVAGALKNHNRAVVIGQQSFGKGSVQVLYDFKDRSALKLTIAQYLTPGDISIQSVGVVPDVAVVPAVVEKEGIHLFVDDDAPREKDLERHLSQHGPSTLTTAAVRMSHLSDKERNDLDPNTATNDNRDEEIATGKFEYDFETHLAHDVLRASKSREREVMVQAAMPLLHERMAAEDAAVGKHMAALDVDWTPAERALSPNDAHAEVKLSLADPAKPVVAGDTVTLVASVHNTGSHALHQVHGVTQATSPLFKGLEFAFGRIEPKQTRVWPIKVKLPADMPPQADSITITLGDPHNTTAAMTGKTLILVAAKKQPSFAFSYRLDDSQGNGDGMLQPGEMVTLRVQVQNKGQGDADDVTVTLKNMAHSHIFLDSGRAKLGHLAPGEQKEAELRFRVNGPGTAAANDVLVAANDDAEMQVQAPAVVPGAGDALSMKLGIWDGMMGASLSESLKFVVAPPQKSKPNVSYVKVQAATAVPVFDGASTDAGSLGVVHPGSVLQAKANWGAFVQVALSPKTTGFMLAKDVVVQKKGPAKQSRGQTWQQAPLRAPPELVVQLPELVAHAATYTLRGSVVSSRPIKDAFVFVDDKKIFFKALGDIVPEKGQYAYTLAVPLRLKEGSNPVAVIVRENEDLMSRRFFSILREPSPSDNVLGTHAP